MSGSIDNIKEVMAREYLEQRKALVLELRNLNSNDAGYHMKTASLEGQINIIDIQLNAILHHVNPES